MGGADVAGDGGGGAVAGLAHDVPDGGPAARRFGTEAGAQRVPGVGCRVQTRARDRAFEDCRDRARGERAPAYFPVAVDGPEQGPGGDPGRGEPELERADWTRVLPRPTRQDQNMAHPFGVGLRAAEVDQDALVRPNRVLDPDRGQVPAARRARETQQDQSPVPLAGQGVGERGEGAAEIAGAQRGLAPGGDAEGPADALEGLADLRMGHGGRARVPGDPVGSGDGGQPSGNGARPVGPGERRQVKRDGFGRRRQSVRGPARAPALEVGPVRPVGPQGRGLARSARIGSGFVDERVGFGKAEPGRGQGFRSHGNARLCCGLTRVRCNRAGHGRPPLRSAPARS